MALGSVVASESLTSRLIFTFEEVGPCKIREFTVMALLLDPLSLELQLTIDSIN